MKSSKKRKARRRRMLFLMTVLLGATAGAYAVCAQQYTAKFIPGTVVNGVNISDQTAEEVERDLSEKAGAYQLTLHFSDEKSETLTADSMGYRYVSDGSIGRLLSVQKPYTWLRGLLGKTTETTADVTYSYDTDKLAAALAALPESQAENVTAPTDATMKINDSSQAEIVPETDGNALDQDKLLSIVEQAISSGETEIGSDALSDAYVRPSVTSDNEELKSAVNDLNSYLTMKITFPMSDGSENVLDGSTIRNWLSDSPDHAGWYTMDETHLRDGVTAYIADLAGKDDVGRSTTVFHSTNYGDVSVPIGATWGHALDQASMVDAVMAAFDSRTSGTQELIYSWKEADPTSIGNTYIEVDIASQRVYYYRDGELEFSTDCVTGTETNDSRRTPSGVYSVLSRMKDHTMRGSYGTAYCRYAVVFSSTGLYFHDASWRDSFGGDTYLNSGSHGCVNLSYDAAKYLYQNVDTGTPVVIFRPDT